MGAGLAGLVTAWQLTRAGVACRVLEASPRAGGRVETVTFDDGVTAEAHMEEFWEGSPAYPLLEELGLELEEDGAHSSVVIDGHLLPYQGDGDRDTYLSGMFDPQEQRAWLRWNEEIQQVLTRLPPAPTDLTGVDWASPLMTSTFSSYVHGLVREPRVAEWIRVVVESETAIEWDLVSALDGVTEMLPFLDSPTGFGETNAHVSGGNQRFVDAMLARLPAGTVRTDEPVLAVRDTGRHVVVRHGADGAVLRSEHVVLAVPLWSLGAIELTADLEPAATAGISSWTAGSYVKVLVRLRPEAAALWKRYGDGLFTLLSDSPAGCVYLTDACDGTDLLLTQLVHAQHARRLCSLPPHEVARRAIQALDVLSAPEPLWPGVGALVTESRAVAYPDAVAYWGVDLGRSRYDESAAALRRPQGRVHLASDTLESSHSDGAVRSGQRVAARLVGLLAGSESPTPAREVVS